MSDLLAKCDWDEDELHVYITEWPEVVYVWVDEKTMPYAPVVADVRSLRAENDRLREELANARDPQRIGGTANPESFVYAIEQLREFRWQHATNDEDAIPYINNVASAHERENAKLRELVRDMWSEGMCECGSLGKCESCIYDYPSRMHELGIEVD